MKERQEFLLCITLTTYQQLPKPGEPEHLRSIVSVTSVFS